MRLNLFASLLLAFSVCTVAATAAHAAPGEAAAVIAACGTPASDTYGTSEVSGLPLRTLVYGDTRLNFEAVSKDEPGSWQFTSGWRGHLPETANEVAKQMSCFGEGLKSAQTAASGQLLAADPSITLRQAAPAKRAPFGIADLWIILFLVGVISIFAVAVPRRRVMAPRPPVESRPYRRPKLGLIRFRRKSKTTILPSRP